ncbi:MAG TPA: hypothetical protein VEH81_16110 [Ktedonobacteraceae bacterium]|nr:hypothetical protein [Ktedonobacteraceae bacterium]
MKHQGLRLMLIVLEAFVALTSLVCGVGLAIGVIQFPLVWLASAPVHDYIILGWVMAIVVGGSSLLAALMMLAGQEAGVFFSALAGFLLLCFEVVEVSLVDRNLGIWLLLVVPLQALYSVIGLTIIGLAVYLWMTEYRHQHFHARHAHHA